ncbi:MAG: hypothetical protein IJ710_06105 [Prevotella sp.]|nr:hypothetical protein [Prevotella sp.]
MEEKSEKSRRGGSRPGSGRPKTSVKTYYFGASPEVYEIMEAVEGSKSQFVNDCILKACGRK